MKLYTEDQVRSMLNGIFRLSSSVDPMDSLTPIELLNDDEIEEGLFHQSDEYSNGYKDAFKLMKSKILNQNK